MPKVSTNLTVTTENDRDLQITTAMFGDVIGILAGNNLSYNLGSYEVVDEVDLDALSDWEKELLDSGHDHKKCEDARDAQLKEETHEPGFSYDIEPDAENAKEFATHIVATMVNDQTGLSYSGSSFEILGIKKTDKGWIAFVRCNDRGEYRYEVTRDIANEETTIEQYVYSRVVTYT